ncbi:MAG: hypothetical protein M3Z75_27515, partial [Actinomycetota bacterium]|nr:hypothetical protein [Actinomycetota bacterium]
MLAALADKAGVFEAAAGVCARAARGSTPRLFLLIAALGTLTRIGTSLDTTAVLLTPGRARAGRPDGSPRAGGSGDHGHLSRAALPPRPGRRYDPPQPVPPADRAVIRVWATACAALAPAVLA